MYQVIFPATKLTNIERTYSRLIQSFIATARAGIFQQQGESVNILLNFTQFFETRIEYRFQI
ncbi:hypothetical protein, partial [Aeromonas hydrophila]